MGSIVLHMQAIRKGESERTDMLVFCLLYICRQRLLLTFGIFESVNIVKVLGEGGFSFVYLAQDEHSGVRPGFYRGHSFNVDTLCAA